jgi:hypothetical protein
MVTSSAALLQVRRRVDDKNRLLRQMASAAGSSTAAAQFAPVDLSEVREDPAAGMPHQLQLPLACFLYCF